MGIEYKLDPMIKFLIWYFSLALVVILAIFGLYGLGYFHPPKVDYSGVVTGHTQIDCGYCEHPKADFHLLVHGDDGKNHIVNIVEGLYSCPVGTKVHVTTGHIEGCP